MPDQPATSDKGPATPRPRGGRRPGAGAPKGNMNALKSGRYSTRVRALRGAMEALPLTTDVLVQLTGRERRKMELLAYGLQYYAEILFLIARGGSIEDLDNIRVRNRVISAIPVRDTNQMVSTIQDAFNA